MQILTFLILSLSQRYSRYCLSSASLLYFLTQCMTRSKVSTSTSITTMPPMKLSAWKESGASVVETGAVVVANTESSKSSFSFPLRPLDRAAPALKLIKMQQGLVWSLLMVFKYYLMQHMKTTSFIFGSSINANDLYN